MGAAGHQVLILIFTKERIMSHTITIVRSDIVSVKHDGKLFNVSSEQTCEECGHHFIIFLEDLILENGNHNTAFVYCLDCENEHVVFLFDA